MTTLVSLIFITMIAKLLIPYSIRMISDREVIQCLVFTMVILTLDAILSSRTSAATPSPWFGTAYGGYSRRNMMLLWLWYCKWRMTSSQQIISAMKLIQ